MGKTIEVNTHLTVHGFTNIGQEYWVKAECRKEVNEDETVQDVLKSALGECQSFLSKRVASFQEELFTIQINEM